ncbi:MAG: CAP domain-containing protein [Ruminococcus sp.]|nr:CAP domain-containing protein [Ruminococcus sp.]
MTMMNRFTKAAVLMLAAVMCISAAQVPAEAAGIKGDKKSPVIYDKVNSMDEVKSAAVFEPKLSSTSLTLTVGTSKTLKVTGAGSVKWSCSDASVCTVNSGGKVTAKGAGTATVYAKADGKTLSCKVNVRKKSSAGDNTPQKTTDSVPANTSSDPSGTSKGLAIKVVDDGYGNQKIILIEYDIDNVNPGSSADYAEEMLKLVNELRAKNGTSALELDDELCKAAQVRAKELGENFSHTRPDGSECFSILKSYNISSTYAGENIAAGTSTSEGAMDMWMDSPGHRSNILRTGWKKLGVGYDESTNSWVQIFVG